MTPTVILPQQLQAYTRNPSEIRYKTHNGHITDSDAHNLAIQNCSSKDILCFIGGFFDTYYRVIFDVFENCVTKKRTNMLLIYISFNCFDFLKIFFPRVLQDGYRINVISHSWGAKNIIRLSLKYNFGIETLVTLDCVGHFNITHRPTNIIYWQNIYISNHLKNFNRANLVALIGGVKLFIKQADENIAVDPPANHASVADMLDKSSFFNKVYQIHDKEIP